MNWQVSTTIHGGPQATEADLDHFTAIADSLESVATSLSDMAFAWQCNAKEFAYTAYCMPGCPSSKGIIQPGHEAVDYPALELNAQERAAEFTALSNRFRDCSEQVARTYSTYSEADHIATRFINEGVQALYSVPGYSIPLWAGTAVNVLGAIIGGSIKEGHRDLSWMSYLTSDAQEGILSAAGAQLGGKFWERFPLGGAFATNEVNEGATAVSSWTAPIVNLFQGNKLEVHPVVPNRPFLDAPRSIEAAMNNLYRLGRERLGEGEGGIGLDYGTIAIQKFRNADGTVNWLVTIPGTDGYFNSPFGWLQNAELMSDDERIRMEADSARMVAEAMRQAGIGKDDAVTMIGHSQGGIVAAVLASDLKDQYDIRHIVTCGSPIANHPIPERTWVTSVEDKDELVSNLDGAQNPMKDTWLTIRGTTEPGTSDPADPFASTTVPGSGPGRTLTHEMPYLQTAFRNASMQGSSALNTHERHFDDLVSGQLEETTYYQGRMRHDLTGIAQNANDLHDQMQQALREHKVKEAIEPIKDRALDTAKKTVKERLDDALRAVHGRK